MLGTQMKFVDYISVRDGFCHCCKRIFIGLTHVIQHKINTGNAAAIKQAPRRIPLAQRKEVEDEIDKMLDNNVIDVHQVLNWLYTFPWFH
jgi:hypothetical protein